MNFMPFGQLKSLLKILIEVQYDISSREEDTVKLQRNWGALCERAGNIACSRALTNSVERTIIILKDITALVKLLIPGFPFRSFQ